MTVPDWAPKAAVVRPRGGRSARSELASTRDAHSGCSTRKCLAYTTAAHAASEHDRQAAKSKSPSELAERN